MPTGMNTGVSTRPRRVRRVPALALEDGSVAGSAWAVKPRAHTVFPVTIAFARRALELRTVKRGVSRKRFGFSLSNLHSKLGSIRATSAGAPAERVPRSRDSKRAGFTVNISMRRSRGTAFFLWTRISQKRPNSVSSPRFRRAPDPARLPFHIRHAARGRCRDLDVPSARPSTISSISLAERRGGVDLVVAVKPRRHSSVSAM